MVEEEKQNARVSRLEKIVMVSHNQILVVADKSLAIEYANTSAATALGYSSAELQRLKLTDLFAFPDAMATQALLNTLRRNQTDRLELQLRFNRKNGEFFDGEVLIQVLEKDQSFVLIISDITDKLVTEKKLLHTIHEKETLIKEIHHRVKNNLQLISSIIYLKLTSVGDNDIRSFLEDTRQKIRSIALIHERLLQTENLDQVEISDYLGKLIQDLKVTYFRDGHPLEIATSLDKQMMTLDTAIICGLIVNELLTNAIKHAFPDNRPGKIMVAFANSPAYSLVVKDNGVGLPASIEPGTSPSFGMQLIDVFVKQLNGKLQIDRTDGTTFNLEFS
ncbi:MAG TPA: histidine kinase dimerization/phosphoacceptor domain -containing protein [Chryseosolibacter sp.]